MNANKHLIARLEALRQSLMSEHAAGVNMPNHAKGTERETFATKLLERIFPAQRRFSTGAITDSSGAITGQVDILVEYGFFPSFPTLTAEPRLIIAEAVAAAIEVKSNLVTQWGEITRKTADVRKIHRKVFAQYGNDPSPQIPVVELASKVM